MASQKRMIDSSMWNSDNFTELPFGARLLQLGIINHADDQGRVRAKPSYLRVTIFPYDPTTDADIQSWLELLASNNTIILYEADGKQYAQLVNWWKYQNLQYAQPSQYPRPAAWQDRVRRTVTKGIIATCNWLKVNGEPIEDTCDQDGKPLPPKRRNGGHSPVSLEASVDDSGDHTDETASFSGDDSGESSPERAIYDYDKEYDHDKEEEEYTANASVTPTVKAPNPPPFVLKANEYLPGIADPRKKQPAQRTVAERLLEAKALGLSAEQFRLVVDALLDGFGKRALVDAGDDVVLGFVQDIALTVVKMSDRFKDSEGIKAIFSSWREFDWRGKTSLPTSEQFKEHASLMVAGKVGKAAEQRSPPTFKEWKLRTYGSDNANVINIPDTQLRQRYEQAIRVH